MKRIIASLIKIANDLDDQNKLHQADRLDKIIKKLATDTEPGLSLDALPKTKLESIARALKLIHFRFKNRSPFRKSDFKEEANPVDIIRMLSKIGISPPYGNMESLLYKIETFKNSGGAGIEDTKNQSIWKQVGEPGYNPLTSRDDYASAISSRDVKNNPRYAPRDLTGDNKPETFCNIYASDVMRSAGIPLPHVIDRSGNPVPFGTRGSKELLANDTAVWLASHGSRFGWERSTESGAQEAANSGHAAIAIIPGGKHIAVVSPGEITEKGATISQAGKALLENAHVADGFGMNLFLSGRIEYWINKSKDIKLMPSVG